MKNVTIAIDGPVGAGKSTIARECAKKLGFIYVDTGALYRALGVYFGENHVKNPDLSKITKIDLRFVDGLQHVFINDTDYTDKIRTPEASMLASKISANGSVREFLLDFQRDFAKANSVVMDGRDIGTVVLPNADVKIFLTADPHERAKRRFDELVSKGVLVGTDAEFEKVLSDLNERDHADSTRQHAPLKQADDAIVVDTTDNSFEQSVTKMLETITRVSPRKAGSARL
ncbi:MAG: (d)CMP kinase [Oscillospiraceae bacterium]|nr:(d)CMP kinase [Oscillospiraceae bacterium]